jgi:hypothetical protein
VAINNSNDLVNARRLNNPAISSMILDEKGKVLTAISFFVVLGNYLALFYWKLTMQLITEVHASKTQKMIFCVFAFLGRELITLTDRAIIFSQQNSLNF